MKENRNFVILVICLFSMRWSLADHYRVPTGSMRPTIQIGDHVLVNKMAYDLKFPFTDIILAKTGIPKRGEIIVFKYPKDPSINYVKRLIAIPGDRVEIVNGLVKVNGQLTLESPELSISISDNLNNSGHEFEYTEVLGDKKFKVKRLPFQSRQHRLSFVVPKDQYFFMEDNRDNSADSRYWGFVPRKNLKGQVKKVTFSITFNGIIPTINIDRFGKSII